MMEFWLIAAVMILVAMALVVVPMVRAPRTEAELEGVSDRESNIGYFREQESELTAQVEQGLISAEEADLIRAELEKKLLNDIAAADGEKPVAGLPGSGKRLALAVSCLIPVLAIVLYMKLGSSTEINATRLMMSPEATPEQVTEALADWAEMRPENAQVLYVLGGRYMNSGDYQRAQEVFTRFYSITNGSPQAGAELAQAIFLAHENTITDRVRTLYKDVLRKEENNITALGLLGIDAFSRQDYRQAIDAWRKAVQLEPDLQARQAILGSIIRAQQMLGEAVAGVRVNVKLAPALQELPASARVIVFARSADSRSPIAVVPLTIGDLPQEIVLDEHAAMVMGSSLDGIERVDIVARVSLSNDLSSTDYEAQVKGVAVVNDKVVQLLISDAG